MCGIAGIVSKKTINVTNYLETMVSAMTHRGPDADGFHIEKNFGFGHRRLSIIDLNDRSNQPFFSNDKRYFVVFNGEIYNYLDLKVEIGNKYKFKTNSDTEVLLASYLVYGKSFINKINGCFSFVIYDKQQNELVFARDRLGIKPFYFYFDKNFFLIASELRAVLSSGLVKKDINHLGLNQFLSFQSTYYPNTIIKNVNMLEPGTFGIFSLKDFKLEFNRYWELGIKSKKTSLMSYDVLKKKVKRKILSSVNKRLIADVELAAFLSGGVDSTIIVGIMKELGVKNINTFSLVHDDKKYDESVYSDIVAKKYNTNHYKVTIGKDELVSEVTNALDEFDSPSADGLNNYIVSKKIREIGIKVALSGLGGDELFAGYPQFKYFYYVKKYKYIFKLLKYFPFQLYRFNNHYLKFLKIIASDFSSNSINTIFRDISGDFDNLLNKQIDKPEYKNAKTDKNYEKFIMSKYSISELNGYTSNVLLKDADQTSMAHGLEVRVPFLDHELVDYILSLPDHYKHIKKPKALLVDTFSEILPIEIQNRKKQGFIIPTQDWMRNELFDISEKNISILCDSNLFDKDNLLNVWDNYLKTNQNSTLTWGLVVLGNWLKNNKVSIH
jgi:asparagine synthase (glutamine-hydrolysing)